MALANDGQYVSQYSNDVLGLTIVVAGTPTDPDGAVTATFINDDTHATVFSRDAIRTNPGEYRVTLTSQESGLPGNYRVRWTYELDAQAQEYDTYVTIGKASQAYDALAPGMKEIVDQVWIRFADLFDSPQGGPHLQVYFESNFSRGRVAQLLRVAIGRLNTISQPHQTYTIDGDGGASFPILTWGPLAEQALYVEIIKHLRRSYVEQPALTGGDAARLDRRDYLDRWGMILEDEEEDLKARLGVFKIANMGLGRPAVLVSGGVYGRFAPTRYAGSAAARGRFWSRMYSVLLAVCLSGSAIGALSHLPGSSTPTSSPTSIERVV